MMKAFAVGAMAAAVIFGSTFGASAQELSPAQTSVLASCAGSALAADGGASCAIALRLLTPAEFVAIRAAVQAGAGTQVAFLDDAIASSGVETGAIDDVPTLPVDTGPADSIGGSESSPA